MSAASATPEAPATTPRTRPTPTATPKKQPRYNVVLIDDDDHSYEYVCVMLQSLFGYDLPRGFQIATEVDTTGRAILLTTTKEHAELKRDQIHAYGPDALIARCKGSMWAIIEVVEDED